MSRDCQQGLVFAINVADTALATLETKQRSGFVEEVFQGHHWASLDKLLERPFDENLSLTNAAKWFSQQIPAVRSALTESMLGVHAQVCSDVTKGADHYLELLKSECFGLFCFLWVCRYHIQQMHGNRSYAVVPVGINNHLASLFVVFSNGIDLCIVALIKE